MIEPQRAVNGFIWFLSQCFTVGGIGAEYFLIGALCLLLFMSVAFRKSLPASRMRFWWLELLPLFWIIVGLWGAYFWLDTSSRPIQRNPDWVKWPLEFGLWIFLALAIALVFYIRGGRTFSIIFSVADLYFMLGMHLMAAMAISGTWL